MTTPTPIDIVVRITEPKTHYVDVSASVSTGGLAELELMMPVWTPGSYMIREYSSQLESFTAADQTGRPLRVAKTRKNRWRIATGGAPRVKVAYRLYCHELSVRNNFVEDEFAVLNGAATFVTVADAPQRPFTVTLELPPGWTKSATALDRAPGGGPHTYTAPDFDTLVDSPILAGRLSVHEFEVDGKRHALVNAGDDSMWDAPRSVSDLRRIVEEWRRVWGFLPYPSYQFLNVIAEGGGGIEHKNCTLLGSTRWQTRTPKAYESWLGLASHEYLHAWNVKRLRPSALGPFDYERENHTPSLWIAEGVTEYYGDLALARAGLVSRDRYLTLLSEEIQSLHRIPGRRVQPLSEGSFDAWIKEYRPGENSGNSTISYYTKGGQVAFLLDAAVRRATSGARTLDDVMRAAYQRYSGARGFTEAEFRQVASEVAGTNLDQWFHAAVDTADELDYRDALAWFGLRFAKPGGERAARPSASLGIKTRADAGRLLVAEVGRESPAWGSGLSVNDELVAIDGYRVRPGQLDDRLAQYRPGDHVVLTVSRRDQLQTIGLSLGAEPATSWTLELDPASTPDQQAHLAAWLAPGVR